MRIILAATVRKFVISGLLATGLHAVVATTLISKFLILSPISNGIAFLIASIFSYILNTIWSFSQKISGKIFYRFVLISTLGGILSVIISSYSVYLELHYSIGIITVVLTVPPITFGLHYLWTFSIRTQT
jgi:putative flippase GtrA